MPCTLRRGAATATLTLLTITALPATAGAVTTYRASIEGTLTTTGTVTTSECYPYAATTSRALREPGFEVPPGEADAGPVARTATAQLRVTFRTVTPARVTGQRIRGGFPAIALADDRKPIRARASLDQRSGLEDRTTPLGCAGTKPPTLDCGTRTLTFGIGMGARGNGLAPDLSKTRERNADTFSMCPLTDGMTGFPGITGGAGTARTTSAAILRGRRLVLHGGRSDRDRTGSRTTTTEGSYRLRYTITLTPVR